MNPGDLRDKITIRNSTASRDAYGASVETWEDYAPDRWAHVNPLAGRELLLARQTASLADTVFTTRWLSGVTPQMRVVWDGGEYLIESAVDVGAARRWLEIRATRIVR